MAQRFVMHPRNPQPRLVSQTARILRDDGLIVYPTDTCYALGFSLDNRGAARTVARIRQTGKDHNFTLMCRDLAEIGTYARIENWTYRLLRAHAPGPYTFILKAGKDMPRRLQNPKRRTIGIRVPDHPVAVSILAELGAPMMSSTLLLPGDELPLNDPEEIYSRLHADVALVIDSGSCGIVPSTVVDLTGDQPVIVREGKGDIRNFQ